MTLLTDIPQWEPDELTAGDAATWSFDSSSTRVPGAVLSYSISGPIALPWNVAWITLVVGNTSTVKIPSDQTEQLTKGTYQFFRHLTDGADRYTVRLPPLRVRANPAEASNGDDTPWQEVAIAAIEGRLAGNATSGMMSYMVGGRQVMTYPLPELYRLLNQLRRELNAIRGNNRPRQRLVSFTPIDSRFPVPFLDYPWR